MVRSEVDPLPPMSCRYFAQSAALAATPAADSAAVASTAATIPLMKGDRCCFILPPEVRQPAVVVNGLAQALGKPGRRPPAEHLISLPAVEGEPADVTGAPLTAMWFDRHAEQLAHLSEDGVDRHFAAAANVEGLPVTGIDGAHVCRGHVPDVHVVLGLLAVPLDHGSFALQQGVQEGGDDMLAGGDVPGAVTIPVAQDRAGHPRLSAQHADVMLAGDLGHAVRTDRIQGLSLRHRLRLRVAVDGPPRGGEDDLAAAGRDRRLDHVHSAEHIDLGIPQRIRSRARNQGLGGEMKDDAWREPPANPQQLLAIADVGFDEFSAWVDVDARAGREVVDDADLMTYSQQRIDQMRPDEARATGDQRPHQ